MAANIQIYEYNGAAQTETTNVSSIDFVPVDESGTNPRDEQLIQPTPAQVFTYSYEKWLKLVVIDMGGASSLGSFRIWYEQDVPETQDTFKMADTSTYITPAVTNLVATTDLPTSDPGPGSPNVTGTLTAVGDKTDFIVLQVGTHYTTMTPPIRAIKVAWVET